MFKNAVNDEVNIIEVSSCGNCSHFVHEEDTLKRIYRRREIYEFLEIKECFSMAKSVT